MKESKLIEMQRKVEVLGSALKNTLIKLNALQEFAQGILTSFQIHIGKDEWEKIVNQLKELEQKEEKEEEELPPSQRK
tara:strand:- start:464 stop:697 length:234 start_codon:yes stop_codon:yes gene_type:complete